MENNDFFDKLKQRALKSGRTVKRSGPTGSNQEPNGASQKSAQAKRRAPRPAVRRAPAQAAKRPAPKPMSSREIISFGWSAAIMLCVLLSVFAVLFASCSSSGSTDGGGEPIESAAPASAEPSEVPDVLVTPPAA